MIIKIQYNDEGEKPLIIGNNKDKLLIEEQHITEGNFLIFTDIPRDEDILKDIKNNTDMLLLKQEGIL